jgi:hypothetical protein
MRLKPQGLGQGRAAPSAALLLGPPAQSLSVELDRLDPQLLRQHWLVLSNLINHRLGCVALEEELRRPSRSGR